MQGTLEVGPQWQLNLMRVNSREYLAEQMLCTRPEIAIFECDTPGYKSWVQCLNLIQLRLPSCGLVAIAGKDQNYDTIGEMAVGGVSAILSRDSFQAELPSALMAIQRGEVHLNPQIAKLLCQQMRATSQSQGANGRGLLSTLTNRELEVLLCLSRGQNYKTIAKNLFVSDSTVKTHVNNIFTKLRVNDRTQAVLYALRHGIEQMPIQMETEAPITV
jgi:DNA-binding NarL/FixJ family response regulator